MSPTSHDQQLQVGSAGHEQRVVEHRLVRNGLTIPSTEVTRIAVPISASRPR